MSRVLTSNTLLSVGGEASQPNSVAQKWQLPWMVVLDGRRVIALLFLSVYFWGENT